MDYLREQVYLAGLLHDIGKFFQRADSNSPGASVLLPKEAKYLESQYCPVFKGKYSHKHVVWTAGFISKYSQVFDNLFGRGSKGRSKLIELASSHHLSAEQLRESPARFIREADHLSSGMDRNSAEAYRDEQVTNDWDAFKKIRMVSIFEGLGKNVTNHSFKYHLPVDSLNFRKDWFPQQEFATPPDYSDLWHRFESEFKFIQATDFRVFSETLLNLLYKYTSTVPASTVNFPDVSLFDHLKTTASIAVCLYDKSLESNAGNEDEFLMIGGDFSGIQSYIYNILSKQASKNLKGRSFYIKLLSDAVVYYLLKELNLFHGNIIYNAGGSFYLLAANTKMVRNKFSECKKTIEKKIFESHGNSLYVAMDAVSIAKNTFLLKDEKNLSDVWKDLFNRRDEGKRHRYSEELINNYEKFFLPGDIGGQTLRDAVTGDELKEEDARRLENDDVSEYVSELTWKQIFLGKKLRDAEFLVISDGPLTYWSKKDFIDPAGLGFCFYFLSKKEVETKREELKSSADKVKIITLKADANGNCDFLNTAIQGYNNVFGFDFLGGNDFPKDEEGHPLTFDKLAGKSDFKRLGYLRMDVDNLGMIFRSGLPEEMITLSRYAALSRNFDWFFKGYINTIWKEKYHQHTNIIYSGGDDLFLIGRWDKVLEFGNDIRKSFKKYVCFNPALSLSGGIAIVPGKYPVKKASVDSDIMEKRAKSHFYENIVNGDGSLIEKAAITVLGIPLNWDNEFETVEDLKNKLIEKLTQKDNFLPKSFITKIEMHYSLALRSVKSDIDTGQTSLVEEIPPKVKWMMAYDFGRLAYRMKDYEVKNLVMQCQRDIFSNTVNNKKINTKYHSLELWNLAARLAELQIRTQDISKLKQ